MATLTTHLLDSVLGAHAGGVGVTLVRIEPSGARVVVFERETDAGGRLSATIEILAGNEEAEYEMVVASGRYFIAQPLPKPALQVLRAVVIRFTMPNPRASYHIPMMLAPNSYSVWWSG